MNAEDRTPSSATARILAPVALIVVALVVVVVVASSLGGSDSDSDGGKKRRDRGAPAACKPNDEGAEARENGYYVIQPGEPGLSAVADQTCIPVEELQRLNPELDSQLIPQGGCVDLRRDGCQALAEG